MRQLHTLPHSVAAAERREWGRGGEAKGESLRERWQLAPVATGDNGVKNEIISKQNDRLNGGREREGKSESDGKRGVNGAAAEQVSNKRQRWQLAAKVWPSTSLCTPLISACHASNA